MVTTLRLVARAGPVLRRRGVPLIALWAASFVGLFVALLVLTDRPAGPRRVALAGNGGFERGLLPWRPYGSGRLVRTRVARSGAASGAAVARAPERYGVVWPDADADSGAGDRYVLTVWMRGAGRAAGDRVYLALVERAPGRARTIGGSHLTLSRTWRRARVRGVAHGPHGQVDVYVFVDRARGAGDTVYLDDVSFGRRRAEQSERAR